MKNEEWFNLKPRGFSDMLKAAKKTLKSNFLGENYDRICEKMVIENK